MSEAGPGERTPCPENARLHAFASGLAGEREAARISTHLLECEICYRKVATLVSLLRGAAARAEPSWPLLPAFATAIAIAIALTLALSVLLPGV